MTYHTTAKGLAALGRNGDTMLMHVNPQEVAALSHVLGPISFNPKTGMPEAYGWGSMLGSIVGGLGSFGLGAELQPLISDAVGEGMMGSVLSKALPAVAGAGLNAAIGGITGGKAGAMGGAAQGAVSGLTGAFAGEKLLGSPDPYAKDLQEAKGIIGADPTKANDFSSAAKLDPSINEPYKSSGTFGNYDPTSQLQDPTERAYGAVDQSIQQSGGVPQDRRHITDYLNGKDIDKLAPYADKLMVAGMIGNTITAQQNTKTAQQQQLENFRRYQLGQQAQANQLAAQTYAPYTPGGYAEGGIVMQNQGAVPVSVHIPQHLVDKVGDAGGIANFLSNHQHSMEGYATGGYVNTQPFNPQQFHPQSRVTSAEPYPAASGTRMLNVASQGPTFEGGGMIEGDGDGMSDDIDANIDGQEDVRVADGEYLVPRHIVDMIGEDRLKSLLEQVRHAAHGKKEQINEGAGLSAAMQELGLE